MASTSLWGINTNNLVSVQVQVNNNLLLETLNKIIDELGNHRTSLGELNRKISDPSTLFENNRSAIATKDELIELHNQMKLMYTENKMFRERIEDMEHKLESLGAEAKVRAERHHEEIQEVYTKIIVERENTQAAMRKVQSDWQTSVSMQSGELHDKLVQMRADMESGINQELRSQVDHIATELRIDIDSVKDLVRATSNRVINVESDIRQLQDEVPLFEREIEEALHDIKIDMTSMNETRRKEISSSISQIRKLYEVMNLDVNELIPGDNISSTTLLEEYKTTHVTNISNLTNISNVQNETNPIGNNNTSSIEPEIGDRGLVVQAPKDSSSKESTKIASGDNTTFETRSASGLSSDLVTYDVDNHSRSHQWQSRPTTAESSNNTVRTILNTPAFVELRRQINREIELVRNDQTDTLSKFEKDIQKSTKEARDLINRFITKDDLRQVLSNNVEYNEMRDLVRQHERNIRHILENYWNKEQTWEALRLKADEKNLELKADRKFVNGLFDYINEKVNNLMGDGSNDKLMGAIKSLEEQLNKKANISDLLEIERTQVIVAPTPPRSQSISEAEAPLLVSRKDLNSGESKNFKCLSCNRPLSPKNPQRSPRDQMKSPRKTSKGDISDRSQSLSEDKQPIKYKVRDSGSIDPWSHENDDSEQYDDSELMKERRETEKRPYDLKLSLDELNTCSTMQPIPPKSAPSHARLKRSKSSGTEYIQNPSIVEVANLGDQIVVGPKSSRQSSLSIGSRRKSTATQEDRSTKLPPL